ncbi:MAG: metallopeptidase [Mogibacterium sp.]|nr:metallopeptidase [Mogibacterium sp.]
MENRTNWDNHEWEVALEQLRKAHGYTGDPEKARKLYRDAAQAEDLAADILKLSQNTLLINLRFLEAAFVRIIPGHDLDTLGMATDGRFLYYNSAHVCRLYQQARELPTRDYLHVVLHCLFRHLFVGKAIRRDLWDLACDIAVENMISKLNLKSLYCEREVRQAWLIRELEEHIPRLSAEWIYKYFREKDLTEDEAEKLRRSFFADEHQIWYRDVAVDAGSGEKDENDTGTPDGDTGSDIDGNNADGDESPEDREEGDRSEEQEELLAIAGQGDEGSGGTGDREPEEEGDSALTPEQLEQAWKDIAERIEIDLDTFTDSWGEGAGDMQQQLREINREKYDYAELLRRFAVFGENVEINDDEFDYIFYTYGMKLYRNMPLVEPLEYKDVKRIREFVIAIDTSESVSGEIVQKFVTKTWNILKQSENFFTRVNVHIIQCGARVEEDVKITTEEEFDQYIKGMVLKGFGGTDFRPVFEHVDRLIRQKEFYNFKGLIYFTDGFGTFPSRTPDYDACFVFLDQGYDLPEVPVWAIKMILKEDQIQAF